MRRSQFDYHSYRGRKTTTDWLKRIALVLAILVVLLVAALLLGQPFFSYTDDGLKVNLPFFSAYCRYLIFICHHGNCRHTSRNHIVCRRINTVYFSNHGLNNCLNLVGA